MSVGQRKEQMEGIPSIGRTELVHDEPSENHTFFSPQFEGYGNHHFKAVHIITNPSVLPDMPHRFFFRQLYVFVNGAYSPADVAAEHIERIAYFLLCHPNGRSWHCDNPAFTDCNDSSFHVCIILYCQDSVYILFSSHCNCRI